MQLGSPGRACSAGALVHLLAAAAGVGPAGGRATTEAGCLVRIERGRPDHVAEHPAAHLEPHRRRGGHQLQRGGVRLRAGESDRNAAEQRDQEDDDAHLAVHHASYALVVDWLRVYAIGHNLYNRRFSDLGVSTKCRGLVLVGEYRFPRMQTYGCF